MKSGVAIFADRLSWARSYMRMAGLVEPVARGVWSLTEKGRSALQWSDKELRRIVNEAYRTREAEKRKIAITKEAVNSQKADSDHPEEDWEDRLLAVLKAMPADGFERLCQRLLREAGFVKVEVSGRSGDGGIDGQGVLRINLVSFQVSFQAKRYAGSVGAPIVRDFRGAMIGRADKGLIITTGTFTPDARREAVRDGAPAIDLVDGEDLCRLLKDLSIGVRTRMVEVVEIEEKLFQEI